MSIIEFYQLTPIEFYYANLEKNRIKETFVQEQYEVARWSIRHLINISGRTIKKMLNTVKEVEIFPWESEFKPNKRVQTPEEMAEAVKRIASLLGGKKKKSKR